MSLTIATAAALLALQHAPDQGRTGVASRDPLEGGWMGRSANWVENAALNRLYHNEGSGLRKVMINTSTPHDGNTYFTVSANVTAPNSFVGLGINSPNTTAYPYISYRSGPDPTYPGASHWFDPHQVKWVLNVNGTSVLHAYSTGDAKFLGAVTADSYSLNTPRGEFVGTTWLDGPFELTSGEEVYRIHLKDGSEIIQFQARIQDLNPSANVTVALMRTDFNATSLTSIMMVTSSGSSSTEYYSTNTLVTPGTQFVDNASYVYYVYIPPVPNTAFVSARTQIRVSDL